MPRGSPLMPPARPAAVAQVEEAHTALMQGIAPLLKAKGVEASSLAHPTQLVVGVWSRPGVIKHDTGYTGAHTRNASRT